MRYTQVGPYVARYDGLRFKKYNALILGPAVLYSNKDPIDCSSYPSSVSLSESGAEPGFLVDIPF